MIPEAGFESHLASFQGHKFHESEIITLDMENRQESVVLAENRAFLRLM
jgi:hypothetical protein